VERGTYAAFGRRTQQLMHALDRLGFEPGDRVATLAWNSARHLEAYFGVPCTGRVLHTLNVRVSPEELAYMLEDADDRAVLVDPDLLPLLEQALALGPSPTTSSCSADRVPETSLSGVIAYEDLIADEPTEYPRPTSTSVQPMGLCYTSGTTGRPKGVVYTHRSTFLHALAVTSHAAMSIGPGDAVLPQVPMFHANAWGMPYAAAAVGAKQVFFAGALEPSDFVDLLVDERVTVAAGVPTVWLGIADELARRGETLPELRHIICGGAQPPRSLIERYADRVRRPHRAGLGDDRDLAAGLGRLAPGAHAGLERGGDHRRGPDPAGLPLPGVEISVRDESGAEVAADGSSMGDLWCAARGWSTATSTARGPRTSPGRLVQDRGRGRAAPPTATS
jgi:fatty-acyl-CoA synthase